MCWPDWPWLATETLICETGGPHDRLLFWHQMHSDITISLHTPTKVMLVACCRADDRVLMRPVRTSCYCTTVGYATEHAQEESIEDDWRKKTTLLVSDPRHTEMFWTHLEASAHWADGHNGFRAADVTGVWVTTRWHRLGFLTLFWEALWVFTHRFFICSFWVAATAFMPLFWVCSVA